MQNDLIRECLVALAEVDKFALNASHIRYLEEQPSLPPSYEHFIKQQEEIFFRRASLMFKLERMLAASAIGDDGETL